MFDIFGNFKGWLCGDLKFLPSDSVARRSRLTALLFVRESAVLVVSMGFGCMCSSYRPLCFKSEVFSIFLHQHTNSLSLFI